MNSTIEPALHSVLGWIPLFGGTYSPGRPVPAMVILTIMTVPIVSSLTREIFATVPRGQGGRARPWRDPLGDGQDRRAALLAAGHHRRRDPRARTGRRRGDRRLPGDRRRARDPRQPLPARRVAGRARSPPSTRARRAPCTISSLAYFGVILFVLSLIFNGVARLLVRGVQSRAARRPGRHEPCAEVRPPIRCWLTPATCAAAAA